MVETEGGRPARLLGLFAHPDDEVFCVGGTFADAGLNGAESMVVSFTHGEAGQIRHAGLATRATLGRTRARELDAACRELGVHHNTCLDFVDGGLATTDRAALVGAAVEMIRSFKPDQVFSFDHTGASGHPDHITVSEVTREACRVAGDPSAYRDRGEPHAPRELLQACFPQSDRLLLRVLVRWLSGLDERFKGSEEFTNAMLMFADGTSMLGYASDHLSVEWFPKGSYIIEQGEPAGSLYMVLTGEVEVMREEPDGTQRKIGRAEAGEFIGEVAIARDQARNAHCVAAENTACFVLSPEARNPHAPAGRAGRPDPVATVSRRALPCGTHEVDVSAQVDRKVRALGAHASQYVMAPGLFPPDMLQELLGTEYFSRTLLANPEEESS